MKKNSVVVFPMIMISIINLFSIISCDKKDKNPTGTSSDNSKVTCLAGCYSMNFVIKGETGTQIIKTSCHRGYTSTGDYIETCTGTVTYSKSGNTYNFSATYDWPNCKITVNVTGVGSCTDKVSLSKSSLSKSNDDCHCDDLSLGDMIIKYKK